MAARSSKSARSVAIDVLGRFDPHRDLAATALNRLLAQTDQRQRATDLVFGTIRNLVALDHVITTFSRRPTERIAKPLLPIVRVGTYELCYNPATPAYSIVNEAVSAAGRSKQAGFVNAVLRGISRHLIDRQADIAPARARRQLLQTPASACEFDVDILPDPDASRAAHLALCFSLPQWCVSDWLGVFGAERTQQICLASNRRPSLYVRANRLKTTAADLAERFRAAGVEAEAVPGDECAEMLRVHGPRSVVELPGFAEGLFCVQDLAASNAVRMLAPRPDWRILDLCAAPGTKTVQLAEMTQDAAQIVATDIDRKRLAKARENVTRLGLSSVAVVPYPELDAEPDASFDAVLLDVPCSNTGVLARRVEARHRLDPDSAAKIAGTQCELLARAARLVKPGRTVCYSTCSIQRVENSGLITAMVGADGPFELVRQELVLPQAEGFDHDGAYIAILRRR